jgi:hypothetical protein
MEEEEVNGRPNHFTRARPAHKRGTWRKGNQILRHNTRPNRQRGCQRKKGETEREDLRKKKAWVEKPAKIKQNSLEKRSWDCKWHLARGDMVGILSDSSVNAGRMVWTNLQTWEKVNRYVPGFQRRSAHLNIEL